MNETWLLLSRIYYLVWEDAIILIIIYNMRNNGMLCVVLSCSVMSDSADLWTVPSKAPLSLGTLQARILGWVAIPSSRGSSKPRDRNPGLSWHISNQMMSQLSAIAATTDGELVSPVGIQGVKTGNQPQTAEVHIKRMISVSPYRVKC